MRAANPRVKARLDPADDRADGADIGISRRRIFRQPDSPPGRAMTSVPSPLGDLSPRYSPAAAPVPSAVIAVRRCQQGRKR